MSARMMLQSQIRTVQRILAPSSGLSRSMVVRNLSGNAASAAASSSSSSSSSDAFSEFIAMMERSETTLGTDATKPFQTVDEISPKLKCGIPESLLRFKSVSFGRLQLAPYLEPGEFQVGLKVNFEDIPIDGPLEEEIFHQIVGPRFNPERNELRLTSNKFASRIENKRYLCSMLDRIVLSTKRLAKDVEQHNI